MPSIAFVDDEKNVLDGIRRMLRGKRGSWDMQFFDSGEKALDALNESPFDIVVSDMKMPTMNGAELLGKVAKKSPQTIRICLSGFASAELILESLHSTHQFIAKPADAEQITHDLQRALQTRDWLHDENLKSLLGGIEGLPALPEIYDNLMQEIASEEGSISRVAELVASDLGLSAEVLKMVNSAFFGLVRHIESIEQAATILGMETIKNIALLTCVMRAFSADPKSTAKREALNVEGQKLGTLAQKFAKDTALSSRAQDHCQIAAMMSVLGDLITLCYEDRFNGDADVGLLGAYLLSIWKLPFPVIEAVKWHRNPGKADVSEISPLVIVHMAYASMRSFSEKGEVDKESDFFDHELLQSVVGDEKFQKWVATANQVLGE